MSMQHKPAITSGVGSTVEISEIESLAKGTIIVGDGAGAPSSVVVGVDNTILQADSAQASGVAWRGEVGIGIAPITGVRLLLPSENDAVTPTLAFGDGDTGFYELNNDTLVVALAGAGTFVFAGAAFFGNNANAASLLNEVVSDTNPTLIPDRADDDTGIGHAGADQLSLIVGGVEAMRLTTTEILVNGYLALKITDTDGTVEGSIWYDASEDKLKFKTAAGVETITSA